MKYTVKLGVATLPKKMTETQAINYGKRHMPADLKAAGFNVVICHTRQSLHGWTGLSINYGK